MKTILVLSILFSVIALPALGELTVQDIEKIDAKIKESETRMKEHMTQQVDSLKTPVAWLIGILVAVIALIGIPLVVLTIMIGWRSVKDNSQEKINQELREEIEKADPSEAVLRAEIEKLAGAYPRYGYRRITQLLLRQGYTVGTRRVARLMKENHLLVSVKRAEPKPQNRFRRRNPGPTGTRNP